MVFIKEIIYLKNDGAYVINLDEHKSIEPYCIALHVNGDNEHIIQCNILW